MIYALVVPLAALVGGLLVAFGLMLGQQNHPAPPPPAPAIATDAARFDERWPLPPPPVKSVKPIPKKKPKHHAPGP